VPAPQPGTKPADGAPAVRSGRSKRVQFDR
jgi:hypothetical protein